MDGESSSDSNRAWNIELIPALRSLSLVCKQDGVQSTVLKDKRSLTSTSKHTLSLN
jgi:hypothetical protein